VEEGEDKRKGWGRKDKEERMSLQYHNKLGRGTHLFLYIIRLKYNGLISIHPFLLQRCRYYNDIIIQCLEYVLLPPAKKISAAQFCSKYLLEKIALICSTGHLPCRPSKYSRICNAISLVKYFVTRIL
jgi:hypothetical protein